MTPHRIADVTYFYSPFMRSIHISRNVVVLNVEIMLYTHTHIHSKSHFADYVEFNFAEGGGVAR